MTSNSYFSIDSSNVEEVKLAIENAVESLGLEMIPQHAPSKRVDVSQVSTANNAQIIIFDANNQDNQKWDMSWSDPEGGYRFRARHSGKYMGVLNGSTDTLAPVVQQDRFTGDARQIWITEYVGDGVYMIKNKRSGLYLDVEGNRGENDTRLIQHPRKGELNQQFFFLAPR